MLIFQNHHIFLVHCCLFTVCLFVVYRKQFLLFRKIFVVMRKTICCLWPALREWGSFTCELFVCRTATVVSRLFTLKLPVTRPVNCDCSVDRRALVVRVAGCYDATLRVCSLTCSFIVWPWDWYQGGHLVTWPDHWSCNVSRVSGWDLVIMLLLPVPRQPGYWSMKYFNI